MKAVIFALVLGAAGLSAGKAARDAEPVSWTVAVQRIGAFQAVLVFTARIDADWHIHSQRVREGGPVPTRFGFEPSEEFSLVGPMTEPVAIRRRDATFGINVGLFEQEAVFQQKLRLWVDQTVVKGFVLYMACDGNRCLPPESKEFSIAVR